MNPDLTHLQPYPFERLNALLADVRGNPELTPIALSIGEPQHLPPGSVLSAMSNNLVSFNRYPTTKGLPELRHAISQWATSRFQLPAGSLTADKYILPVCGTREALFSFVQAVIDRNKTPLVVCPNPFYQIYEGASLLAGASLYFLNCTEENGYDSDFDAIPPAVWRHCQLLFLCSPGNPTGRVIDSETYQHLIKLADQYDFIIASDECYSELYFDESNPPAGLLQACADMGRDSYQRCVVFHSLSKRSNLPGLRSGFVAGDSQLLENYLRYRTYHGATLPLPVQMASIAAWQDEVHVAANREEYRKKFAAVNQILADVWELTTPSAGFYYWAKTPIDDTVFAKKLFQQQNIKVLPGSYLGRKAAGINPGDRHVRIALVAQQSECTEAARRIVDFIRSL